MRRAKSRKTLSEWVSIAKHLARKHRGLLPNPSWLHENGYASLYGMIRRHPRAFAGIKQEKLHTGRTISEWLQLANNLAERNNGLLPNNSWLKQNGFSQLISLRRRHPGLFKSIKQESLRTTLEHYIALAENLAKMNGGTLPSPSYLNRAGYTGLRQRMQLYPASFKHIPQIRNGIDINDSEFKRLKLFKNPTAEVIAQKMLAAYAK